MSKDKDETAINLLFEVYDAGIGHRTVDLTGYLDDIKQALNIADVVGSEERTELVCGFCGTNKAEVCFKCHTNECVSAAGQN